MQARMQYTPKQPTASVRDSVCPVPTPQTTSKQTLIDKTKETSQWIHHTYRHVYLGTLSFPRHPPHISTPASTPTGNDEPKEPPTDMIASSRNRAYPYCEQATYGGMPSIEDGLARQSEGQEEMQTLQRIKFLIPPYPIKSNRTKIKSPRPPTTSSHKTKQ